MSSSSQRRKKPVTYGKSSRNSAFTPQSVESFFDERDKTDRASSRRTRLPTRTPVSSIRAPPRQAPDHDEFDVPLSDDDEDEFVPVAVSPSSAKQKRKSQEDAPAPKRTRTSSPISPPASTTIPPFQSNVSPHTRPVSSPQSTPRASYSSNPRRSGRNAPKTSSIHPLSAKGMSAPGRLNDMLSSLSPTEEDVNDPDHQPATPAASSSVRPATLRRATSTTPKQSQLWSQLLSSDPVEPDVDSSTDRELPRSRNGAVPPTRSSPLKRSTLDMPHSAVPRQARLLDRLKDTADDDDEDEDDETLHEDNLVGNNVASASDRTLPRPRVTFSDQSQSQETRPVQSDSQVSLAQSATSGKVTYARTRSYLEEDTLEASLMLSMPTATHFNPSSTTRSARGKNASTFDYDDDSDQGTIQSIHDLRAAGNKKLFMDDNSALLDDIKDHRPASKSRRRSALMELAIKMFDKTFLARFVEHGFDRDLAAEFTLPYTDLFSDFALCIVLIHISKLEAGEKVITALYHMGALALTSRCLNDSRDVRQVAKDRRSNISKVAQSTFLDFTESVRTSAFWQDIQPESLTAQLLGLKCMESMAVCLRRQGNKGGILDSDVVTKLVGLSISSGQAAVNESPTIVDTITHNLALSILEFASTSNALSATSTSEPWQRFLSELSNVLHWEGEPRVLSLKLCINLTNNNIANCDVCAQSEAIKISLSQIVQGFRHLHEDTTEQEHKSHFDSLILSLGLMINLAEFSEAAREKGTDLSSDGLPALVDVFLRGQERLEEAQSEEETQSNVAYGFLAVLLGNMCQNTKARDEVCACLPGKTLAALVAAIDEFAQYNMKVDSQTFEGDEGREVWEHFTGRLMAVVARLQESED